MIDNYYQQYTCTFLLAVHVYDKRSCLAHDQLICVRDLRDRDELLIFLPWPVRISVIAS